MIQISSSKSQAVFKEISKDTFIKYKKVRKMDSALMGEYFLYNKDNVKYIVKELPKNLQFFTTRPLGSLVFHKYTSPKSDISFVIYPILGVPLQSVIRSSQTSRSSHSSHPIPSSQTPTEQSKELSNLLFRHNNSLEKVFLHILKFLMRLIVASLSKQDVLSMKNNISQNFPQNKSDSTNLKGFNLPIHMECIRVHNGELMYCFDTWMSSETEMVLKDIRQIQNLFLEDEQLKRIQLMYNYQMKNKKVSQDLIPNKNQQNLQNCFHSSKDQSISFGNKDQNNFYNIQSQNVKATQNKIDFQSQLSLFSSIYKPFLLVLYIGSMELNLRNLEWGQFKLNYDNIQKRLHHFKLRYNHNSKEKLGDLLQKMLFSKKQHHNSIKMDELISLLHSDQNQKQNQARSSYCKSQMPSSSIKAPTRVTLSKKRTSPNQLELSNSVQLRQNYMSASVKSSGNFQTQCHNQNLSQNIFTHQNGRNISKLQNISDQGHNKTLSNMILRQSRSQQCIETGDYLNFNNACKNNSKAKHQVKFQSKNSNTPVSIKHCRSNKSVSQNIIRQSLQSILTQPLPPKSVTLLKLLNLQDYLPKSKYEENLIQKLSQVTINRTWIKKQYKDGGFYVGQVSSNQNTNNTKQNPHYHTENHLKQKQLHSHNPQNQQSKTLYEDTIIRQGYGLYLFPSNDIYYGNWNNNLIHGNGTYVFNSGEIFVGELKHGKKHGYGSFMYSDGRKYQGFWQNDHKNGLGLVDFPNNCNNGIKNAIKINQFQENQQQKLKVQFVGQFSQSKPQRQVEGIFTGYVDKKNQTWTRQGFLSDYEYENGCFCSKENKLNTKKCFKKINHQNILKCEASKYKYFSQQDDKLFEGQMVNHKKNGLGTQETSQYCFQGNFVDNLRDGKGKLTVKQQFIVQGEWKNGLMVSYQLN